MTAPDTLKTARDKILAAMWGIEVGSNEHRCAGEAVDIIDRLLAADREARPAPASSVLHYDRSTHDKFELGWNAALDRLAAASTPPAEPGTVPWPVIDSYAGGADLTGGFVNVKFGDGPETVRYVPAASEARATGDAADIRAAREAAGWIDTGPCVLCSGTGRCYTPSDLAPAAPPVAPLTRERHIALREAHCIESGDAFWKARAHADTLPTRIAFDAGFARGFDIGCQVAATGAGGEPQPREGWKPIETAPSKGPLLLVSMESPDPLATFGCYPIEGSDGEWRIFSHDSKWRMRPTHWMPLPTPPQADSGAAGGQGDKPMENQQ